MTALQTSAGSLLKARPRISAAASGRSGDTPPLKSSRMSIAYFEMLSASIPGTFTFSRVSATAPKIRRISANEVCSCSHTPERSGLPVSRQLASQALQIWFPIRRARNPRRRKIQPLRLDSSGENHK